jgi:hypothetical protein
MDLTYLYAVVAFLATTLELASALTGRFIQRSQTASAGYLGRRQRQLTTKSRQPEQTHGG